MLPSTCLLRRPARLLLAWCLAAGLLAAPRPAAGATEDQSARRALLTLSVNGVQKTEVLVLLRAADAMIPVRTLEAAGLQGFTGKREVIEGQAWVSLASLAPAVAYTIDERALTIALTADPALLGRAVVNLQARRPEMEYLRATSGFLNYGVNWSEAAGAAGALETGLSAGPAVAVSTLSYDRTAGWVRGLSNVTWDRRSHLQRWRVGDSAIGARSLASGLVLGGLHVSRDTSIDPYFVQFPRLGLSGTALTPSTVDVYVNDRLVSRQQVSPGSFDLANVPMANGSNSTRVVVRDAFGREQQMSAGFYLTTSVLARGLHDYDYAIGARRGTGAGANWAYGTLAATARHRYGVTDSLTLGFWTEGTAHQVDAGPTANVRLPFGEVELSGAASRSGGRTGAAGLLGFTSMRRTLGVSGTLRAMSRHYATLAVDRPRDLSRVEASGMLSAFLGRGVSLSLQQQYADRYDGPATRRTGVALSAQLFSRLGLFVNAARGVEGGRHAFEVFAGLTVSPATRTSSSVWAQRRDGAASVSAEIQRALPVGTGLGYRARLEDGFAQGAVSYQGAYGRYEASEEIVNGRRSARVEVTGGAVAIGGGVHAAREVTDSYALVRVPDVAGVRTFANNQEVGRTGHRGDVLVSNLLPYYANRLRIADQDVPMDRTLTSAERVVAPPYRGGSVVVFPALRLRSVSGTVVLAVAGQTILPALGQFTVVSGETMIESPIGRQGEFYFENLAPGRYPAVVQFQATTCRFQLEVPSAAASTSMGVVRCVATER